MLQSLMNDPQGFLLYMLYRTPAVLIALTLHEVAHGYMAYRYGDPTAKMMGRLSLNPLQHLDPWGTISMFLLGVGWAKPVPVNPRNFRNLRRDDLLVSLAGVIVNLLLFLATTAVTIPIGKLLYESTALRWLGLGFFLDFRSDGFLLQLDPRYAQELMRILRTPWLLHFQRFLFQFSLVNIGLGLFNLLPFPPLDGFRVVNNILFRGKIRLNSQVFRLVQAGLMIFLITTDYVSQWLWTAITSVQGAVLQVMLTLAGMR
ncbi:MAG: site-2 protease family protein [Clostridiales bacterium]|nr:site-2 protease family protein [Clostridiales bacterium]